VTTAAAPARTAEHTRARRAVALRLHPDRGGDQDEFVEALRRVDEAYAVRPPDGVPVHIHRTTRARVLRALRDALAGLQRSLPRSCPGSRRYGHL